MKLSLAKLTAAGYQVDQTSGLSTHRPTYSSQTGTSSPSGCTSHPPESREEQSTCRLTSPEKKLLHRLRRPTAGSLNLLRHLDGSCPPSDPTSSGAGSSSGGDKQPQKAGATFADFFATVPPPNAKKGTAHAMGGVGDQDGFIDLGPMPALKASGTAADPSGMARQRAASLIRSRGGLEAMNAQGKMDRRSEVVRSMAEQSRRSS